MGFTNWKARWVLPIAAALGVLLIPFAARAHCDRVNGPVAQAATEALKRADFQRIAMWVGADEEEELRRKFEQSLRVYREGGEAARLAERYLMETTVRLHRAAEGMPYTGLKPAREPAGDIAVAERALETGKIAPVQSLLTRQLSRRLENLFQAALQARRHKDESVEAGRKYADAYVRYIVFVHGLHQRIEKGPAHGVGD